MKKFLAAVSIVITIAGCNEKQTDKQSVKLTDTVKNAQVIDETPDSDDYSEASLEQARKEYLHSYNQIDTIDRVIIDGSDSLHLRCKYYCLHDSSLIIPAMYDWREKGKTEFITHNFATQIILIKNRDTVLNKTFEKVDFINVLYAELQKYAVLFSPGYIGYNKTKEELAIGYSVSIPITDLGVPVYIVVNKNGNYKVLDEYAEMKDYKK